MVAVIAEAIKADSSDEERGMLGCRSTSLVHVEPIFIFSYITFLFDHYS